jgi:hypothetical protein
MIYSSSQKQLPVLSSVLLRSWTVLGIPEIVCAQAYLFDDYWEDIGTIKSFFDANLALTAQVIAPYNGFMNFLLFW